MANLSQILQNITDAVLTGGRRTTAENVRALLSSIANSYANFETGGVSFESEVGYKDTFRPTDPAAFAAVDMIASSPTNPINEQYWKDASDVVWKVTISTEGTFQFESI